MNINKITVINFGSIRFFEISLNDQISVIETKYISELSAVFDIILCKKSVSSLPNNWLSSDTEIAAVVCIDNIAYYVNAKFNSSVSSALSVYAKDVNGREMTKQYLSLLSHCAEQDAIESFDVCDKSIPLRLCWYRNTDDYEPSGELEKNSEYIATTKTFRATLAEYIKAFEPVPLDSRKRYNVVVNQNGKFDIICRKNEEGCLGQINEKLFLYICFLNIAEFWSDIESIRNINYVKKPLVIKNLIECLDESAEIENLIKRTLMLKRQMIFVTLPIKNKIINKWIGDKL